MVVILMVIIKGVGDTGDVVDDEGIDDGGGCGGGGGVCVYDNK